MKTLQDSQLRQHARTAGFLYLIVVLTGMFSLAYVPSQIPVDDNAAKTVATILANLPLYRLGIVASLVCYCAFLVLPLALYRLLSPYGKNAAVLMVAFAATSVPITYVNILHKFDVLSLLSGADYLHAFTTEQLHAQVMFALDAYDNGLLVSQIFWGLWLMPFGYLVFTSRVLPRLLGVLLMLGCLGYLVSFLGHALHADYVHAGVAGFIRLPAALGEMGTCLWLLIMGARMPMRDPQPMLKTAG